MITHKDSFAGADGKLQDIGGSHIFTTPHTVDVPTEYSIELDSGVRGDLVANSLDGRLWMFRDANSLWLVALNWNTSTGRLSFSAAKKFANNSDSVLARGIDWVLTDKHIFMASERSPYVRTSDIFDAGSSGTFLYSLLRKGSIAGSGTDPFTGSAWGARSDNGNSNGKGYFSRDTHLLYPAGAHTFEQCYSALPAVGDWQLFENFLIRRPNAPLSDGYNGMLNVRPLIPLELKDGTPTFGTGYNLDHRGVQLVCGGGKVWARGMYNIGQALILPAVFDAAGDPAEFYLYITPDYPCSPFLDSDPMDTHDQQEDIKTFGGHSFLLFDTSLTWPEAEAACEAMGGHLATSTSSEKNDFLASLSTRYVSLGGIRKNGVWQWVTGEQWDFSRWKPYFPADDAGADFLFMRKGSWENDFSPNRTRYICEWDYIYVPENLGDLWLRMGLLADNGDSVLGVLAPLAQNLTGGYQARTDGAKIFQPDSKKWLDVSLHNGRLFADVPHSQALLLNDHGAQFFGADFIECSALPLWLAPAGNVDAVCEACVLSQSDSSLLVTETSRGFCRQALAAKTLPLSVGYSDMRAAIALSSQDDSASSLQLNTFAGGSGNVQRIAWSNIYKQFLDGYESLGAMESAAEVSVPMGSWQDSGVDLEPGAHIAGSAVWQILTVDFNTGRFVPLLEINAPIMAIVESSLVQNSFSGPVYWTYEYWYIDFDADPPHWAMDPEPAEGYVELTLLCACNKIVRYEKPTLSIDNGRLCLHSPKNGASDSLEYEDVYYDMPSSIQSIAPERAPHFSAVEDRFSVRGAEPSAGIHFFLHDGNAAFASFSQFVDPNSFSQNESIYLHTLAYLLDKDIYRVYSLTLHIDIFSVHAEVQRSRDP